jgi:hypothetical protein
MAQTYSLIQAQTLTSAAATVTFTNIPQNFTDLVVKISTRSAAAGSGSDFAMGMTINGVGTNRTFRRLEAYNGTVIGSDSGSTDFSAVIQGNSTTASTFNNVDIYFPNYTSSNNKIFSVDGVNENNSSTGNDIYLFAGLWSQTAAITSLGFYDKGASSNFLANSTFYLYGVGGTRAIGGTITSDANYTYHTFTSSNTFTALEKINNAQILLVAGGGGGGGGTFTNANSGGGGGAGGVLYSAGQTFTAGTSYSAIVGAGGAGGSTSVGIGSRGQSSTFISSEAIGGGGGGSETGGHGGTTGGSGGGASSYSTMSGSAGTAGQGNAGGSTAGSNGAAAGGGGAGGVGINATNGSFDPGAPGGIGTTAYNYWHYATSTGVLSNGTYYIAGGGGGGSYRSTGGAGGLGGGGQGGQSTNDNDTAGTANTGGGGGGSANQGAGRAGSAGGSGLVIIRYPNI